MVDTEMSILSIKRTKANLPVIVELTLAAWLGVGLNLALKPDLVPFVQHPTMMFILTIVVSLQLIGIFLSMVDNRSINGIGYFLLVVVTLNGLFLEKLIFFILPIFPQFNLFEFF